MICEDDPSQRVISITKETMEIIMRSEKIKDADRGDAIAVWMFYAYTAKWQSTNKIKATTLCVSDGLGWSEPRVRKARIALKELGLIEDLKDRDEKGVVQGHYVRVRFLIRASISHTVENPQCGESGVKCLGTGYGNASVLVKKEYEKPATSLNNGNSAVKDSNHQGKSEHKCFTEWWIIAVNERNPGYFFTPREGRHLSNVLKRTGKTAAELQSFTEIAWRKAQWHGSKLTTVEWLDGKWNQLSEEVSAAEPEKVEWVVDPPTDYKALVSAARERMKLE